MDIETKMRARPVLEFKGRSRMAGHIFPLKLAWVFYCNHEIPYFGKFTFNM